MFGCSPKVLHQATSGSIKNGLNFVFGCSHLYRQQWEFNSDVMYLKGGFQSHISISLTHVCNKLVTGMCTNKCPMDFYFDLATQCSWDLLFFSSGMTSQVCDSGACLCNSGSFDGCLNSCRRRIVPVLRWRRPSCMPTEPSRPRKSCRNRSACDHVPKMRITVSGSGGVTEMYCAMWK